MANVEEKQILFVTGSNSDYTGEDEQLLNDITEAVGILNGQNPNQKIVIHPDICSADKTPDILFDVLTSRNYDGIIGCGGKSLVLAYSATQMLREEIDDPEFEGWTPTVFIPMKDTVTGGASAYWSIVDVPSAAEPRPGVAVGNVQGAFNAVYQMLFTEFTGVQIAYGRGGEQAAEKIAKFLNTFGLDGSRVTGARIDTAGGREFRGPSKNPHAVQILVYDPTNPEDFGALSFFENPAFTIIVGEKKHVPDISRHFEVLERFGRENPFVSVGVGNYDAAAIQAAHLLRNEGIEEKIMAYKTQNAKDNVLDPRAQLHKRFPEGIG